MRRPRIPHRTFLRVLAGTAIGGTLAGMSGLCYAQKFAPENIEVTNVSLTLPRLTPLFDGYRIVQISDIHMDDWMTFGRLTGIIELINEQKADLIAITGDFVTYSAKFNDEELIDALSMLRASDGVVAVLGNHDHEVDPARTRSLVHKSGVSEVGNGFRTIWRSDDALHLAGVDDLFARQARLHDVLKKLPDEGTAILLAHEPDFADVSAPTGRFDLQLSGHSHGGQVRLPFIGAPYLPPYGRRYPCGLYEVDGMLLYTNRGLGMFPPHIRILCRPEITVFTLRMTERP
ncbi:MAG: metallophosphoesterase [Rubrobacter sp.]|nr:metallophosphoesterase [Rubrobacter sp.]